MKNMKEEIACFAMGCFWTPQLIFGKISGVIKTEVGYMGGEEKKENYTYEDVLTDKTGHAEVVRVFYDSNIADYNQLLDIFWKNHDPTQMNRQGPDVGTQYRTAIFYYSEEQKKKAEKSKIELQKHTKGKIVTEIAKAGKFYKAEDYHQNYLKKRGLESCHINY